MSENVINMTSVARYLKAVKDFHLEESSKTSIRKVVMGNESSDLDSVVCSLVYSYFLHVFYQKGGFESVLPVLNMLREDFPLKTEVSHWLNKFSISEDVLLFRDDINMSELASSGRLELYLVDQNVLASSDDKLEPYVLLVIDHHQLERNTIPANGLTIEPVGSCATLVMSEIMKKCPKILSGDIAWLLYGVILVDTVNLSETAKRATHKDVDAIKQLEDILQIGTMTRLPVFEELVAAKSDVSCLTCEQVFKKDLKIVSSNKGNIAIASIPILIQTFFMRPNAVEQILSVHLDRNLQGVILMGIDITKDVRRELSVISSCNYFLQEISWYLCEWNHRSLQLEKIVNFTHPNCFLFHQKNKTASRKVILPVVKEWIKAKQK